MKLCGLLCIRVISAISLLAVLAGCSQNAPNQGNSTPTPSSATSSIPSAQPAPTDVEGIWPPTPVLMDQVWQPAEPKTKVEMADPTQVVDSPDALIVYEAASVAGYSAIKVTTSGQVVMAGYQGSYTTYTLPTNEFDSLKLLIEDTDFFNLQDRYWEEDPPGVIVEMTIVIITYKQDERSKTVRIRGDRKTPLALSTLEGSLQTLFTRVRTQGAPSTRPQPLVGYYLDGTGHHTWWLDVDVEGGLYYGNGPADAHLSPEDLKALNVALEAISDIGEDTWYTARDDVRDTIYMSEHRAIITTYTNGEQNQWINALSGGDVPKPLDALLNMLAEVYDKYAP